MGSVIIIYVSHLLFAKSGPLAYHFTKRTAIHILSLFLCVSRGLCNLVLMLEIDSFRCFLPLISFPRHLWRSIWICTYLPQKFILLAFPRFDRGLLLHLACLGIREALPFIQLGQGSTVTENQAFSFLAQFTRSLLLAIAADERIVFRIIWLLCINLQALGLR